MDICQPPQPLQPLQPLQPQPKLQPPPTPSKPSGKKIECFVTKRKYAEDYEEGEALGTGSYGKVMKCIERRTQLPFAVKIIALSSNRDCPHPNIVQCYKHWKEDTDVYILLELCTSSLEDFWTIPYSEKMVINLKYQIASGLSHLHNKLGRHHGDLKPANILVLRRNSGRIQYKLADFGAKKGDGQFLAPELLNPPKPTDRRPSDIFSLGLSLYSLAYGKQQWTQKPPCVDTSQIRPEEIYLDPANFTPQFVSLLKKMMSRNPAERPEAHHLLRYKNTSNSQQFGDNQQIDRCSTKRGAGSPGPTSPPKRLRLCTHLSF